MSISVPATSHTLNFNSLSPDKFEEFCLWIVEDSGEYTSVEYYGGPGDKNRDVIGYTYDNELDYFQCKRSKGLNYSILKKELDAMSRHVKKVEIRKPRRIYFVLYSSISPSAKDKLKKYAGKVSLPEPTFWEPVILDKKIKRSSDALKNFFGIGDEAEEHLPQVDLTGVISGGTKQHVFSIVNNGDVTAIDCSWGLWGFGGQKYPGLPDVFDLRPDKPKELVIDLPRNFMKNKPIRELRLRFRFRDKKNNWYYSERMLAAEKVKSGAFYQIRPRAGEYIPTKPLEIFSIDSIELLDPTGDSYIRLVSYKHADKTKTLKIQISQTLTDGVWKFDGDELGYAFKELAEKKIKQMIRTGGFEDDFVVNSYLKPTQKTGFEAYKELRNSIK